MLTRGPLNKREQPIVESKAVIMLAFWLTVTFLIQIKDAIGLCLTDNTQSPTGASERITVGLGVECTLTDQNFLGN